MDLIGPGGLLTGLAKTLLETALKRSPGSAKKTRQVVRPPVKPTEGLLR
jgi:hypothetical protein